MHIGERLEFIRYTLVTFSKNFENYSPMTRRIMAIGVIAELLQLNKQLEELCLRLDSEISEDDAEIDFDDWLTNSEWVNGSGIFDIVSYLPQDDKEAVISHMVDYLPSGKNGNTFTPEQAETFKTCMHQLCDDEMVSARYFIFAIDEAIYQTVQLLREIKRKKTNIPSYLFEDYWYSFISEYMENSPVPDIYGHWKEEHDDPDIDMLKDKQMQEILILLKSGFLSHTADPTRREIQKSVISISKDSFDKNTKIPEDIDMECARLSKFVEWKDDTILTLKYEKLGRYIYKHFKELTEKEKRSIAHFDMILDLIHEDMALLDPKYKIYLKKYAVDELELVYEDCKKILDSCNVYLSEKVGTDLFGTILQEVMYGEMKNELKSKLGGSSKMTTLCTILAVCRNSGKVFKTGVTTDDLAGSVAAVVERPSKDSLKRYIENGSTDIKARIYANTEAAIKHYLNNMDE